MIKISFKCNYKYKLQDKIHNHVISNYTKVNSCNFELGEIPYNFRCHLNAVQKIKENKAEEVYLCMTIDINSKEPTIHFINKKGDKYIDNTWGWLHERNDYYIIRKVDESEYYDIGVILENTRKSLLDLYSKNWVRKLLLKNDLII